MEQPVTKEARDVASRARELLAEVDALRDEVAREGRRLAGAWRKRIARDSFAASSLNFAQYLVLRRHDLRPLQRRLMSLGVSSLGRLEGRVLATLDAVAAALAALAGEPPAGRRHPSERQFFRGEARLAANASEILGAPPHGRIGRIMVTLGTEAAGDPDIVHGFAGLGADAFRINCAHDTPAEWERMVAHIRAAEAAIGRRLPVLMDIGGPKVRIGAVSASPELRRVHVGDTILLCREIAADRPPGDRVRMTSSMPEVLDRVAVGDEVSLDDGKLSGRIVEATAEGFAVRLERGKLDGIKLKPEKGLNFPATDLKLDPLTDKDRADLDFIVGHADMIGHSFVQNAAHVAALQTELAARTPDWRRLGLVGKIETPRAVRNLPEIIVQAAGQQPFAVMIARGDLAVEMGFARVAEMQEEMLWLCEAAHVPVIWATQVLEDLVKEGLPSRGEMTDAAMAARAECVLLNKGPNVAGAIATLDRLLHRMGGHQVKKTPTLRALRSWPEPLTGDADAS